MPSAGGEARANQLATLAKVRHEMFCDDEVGRLIEAAAGRENGAEPGEPTEESIDADLVRVVSRDWGKARRVPSELRAEMAGAESRGEQAWVEARKASDYSMLLPTWSETSSWPAATPTATRASSASATPTTRCWTSTSRR